MAEPKVSILLTMVDKLSQPIQGVRGQLTAWKNDFKSLGAQATELLSNKLIQGVGLYGLHSALQKAFEKADEFRVATQKLDGTAKITGASLDWLTGIADEAAKKFGLNKAQAADFAVEMAKLATKAGDVGKAAPALQAFLDIGAARGLTASETLKAVQQAILGIDEGTDKLFNANPSVLYAAFAAQIGTTAGKLTDQEKAQALLNAAMTDGSKVLGAYSAWLETTAGKLQLAQNRADAAYAALGESLSGVRVAMADGVTWISDKIQAFVGGLQLIGNDIGYFFNGIPVTFKILWEQLLMNVGAGIEKLGKILPFVGDKIEEVGQRMKASHDKSLHENIDYLNTLAAAHEEAAAEIVGVAMRGQVGQTAALRSGIATRANATSAGHAAAKAAESDAQKAQADLHKQAADAQLALLDETQRQMLQLNETFHRAMQTQDRSAQEQAKRDYKAAWLAIHDSIIAVIPRMAEARTELKGLTTDLSTGAPVVKETASNFWTVKDSVQSVADEVVSAANATLTFTKGLGMTNPEIEKTVQNIGHLAEGISMVSKAITPDGVNLGGLVGGIAAGITGLQGIIGSLFGDSPAERARKELLRQNTVALDRLKNQIGDLMQSQTAGGKIAKAQDLVPGIAGLASGSNDTPDRMARSGRILQMFAAQGLGKSDIDSILADLGIDWGDWTKNGLSKEQVQQFVTAMGNWEPNRFDQSFSGQQDYFQSYFNVAGIDDPLLQAEFIKGSLKGKNDFLYNLLNKYDLSTPEGRAGLRDELANIYQSLNNGTFQTGNFGDLTGSEFADFIEMFSGLLTNIEGAGSGGGGSSGGGSSASFTEPATSTVTGSFTAGSLGITADAPVFAEIAQNTRETADNTALIARLLGSGAVPGSSEALDEALATTRDLYLASQGQ